MDIASLRVNPFTFEVEPLGTMTFDATKAQFFSWVDRHFHTRPRDGKSLVTALITEVFEFKGGKPDPDFVSNLEPKVLDAVAAAIRKQAGQYFVGFSKEEGTDQVRASQDVGLPDLAEALSIETSEADQLLQDIRAWHHRNIESSQKMISAIKAASGASVLMEAGRQSRLLDAAAGISSVKFLQDFTRQTEWMRSISSPPLEDLIGINKSIAFMQSVTNPLADLYNRISLADNLAAGNLWHQSEMSRLTAGLPNLSVIGEVQKQFGLAKLAGIDSALSKFTGVMAKAVRDYEYSTTVAVEAARYASMSRIALEGIITPGISSDILKNFDQAPSLDTPFFGEALRRGQTLDTVPEIEHLLEVINKLLDQARADRKEGGEQKWIGRLSLMVALVCMFLAAQASYLQVTDKSEAYLKKIKAHEAAIQAQNARLLEELSDAYATGQVKERLHYVPQRTPLRAEPKGPLTRYVFPDQTVRITKIVGDWALVEVFSYENEAVVSGWIYRGNLRVMPAQ
jgi:hypothetical protein